MRVPAVSSLAALAPPQPATDDEAFGLSERAGAGLAGGAAVGLAERAVSSLALPRLAVDNEAFGLAP